MPSSSLSIRVRDFGVERMHFESCNPDEKPRSSKLLHLVVLSENVAHISGNKKHSMHLRKLLHTVDVLLVHFPVGAGAGARRAGFFLFTRVVSRERGGETSVTRSLITGNDFIGLNC